VLPDGAGDVEGDTIVDHRGPLGRTWSSVNSFATVAPDLAQVEPAVVGRRLNGLCGSNRAGTSAPTTYRFGKRLVTASTGYEVASENRRRRDRVQRIVG
jgi:hypothetical protein